MGRIGIGFEEVADAALQLQAQGKAVTVDAVRNCLGTGSKTTISHHLKKWKAEFGTPQGALPAELLTVVTGLWERLQTETRLKIEAVTVEHRAECENLQSSLNDTQQKLMASEQEYSELDERFQVECKRTENLETEYRQIKQAFLQLQERYTASNNQLNDTKAENSRLHQLASQIQTNLEHYQQAIEQLRIEQALENEKQNTIHHQQLGALTEKANALSYELDNKSKLLLGLNSELSEVRSLVEVLRGTSHLHENDKLISQERVKHLEQVIKEKTAHEMAEKSELITLKLHLSQLLQQNQRLQTTVEHLLKKQENIESEKVVLKKENNQLQLEIIESESN
jgi:chromosome segregation ATPase